MIKKIKSMFSTKKLNIDTDTGENEITEKELKRNEILFPRPKICFIDIDEKIIETLRQSGFTIEAVGTLGSKVKVPNTFRGENTQVLPNLDFPNNLHEFDITIIDQDNARTIEYDVKEHTRTNHTGMSETVLLSIYPERIFDPRPFGSVILKNKFNELGEKKHLIINFAAKKYNIEYQPVAVEKNSYDRHKAFSRNIYDFNPSTRDSLSKEKTGREVTVCISDKTSLKDFLIKYLNQVTYYQTFYHPTQYSDGKHVPDSNYFPLLKNTSGDIVSMLIFDGNKYIFNFPQIHDKGKFLNEFLTQVAPSLFPDLFPYSTTFQWRDDKAYWLPNHERLINDKKLKEIEYKRDLEEKNLEIKKNLEKYSFLHEILTETGDDLVEAIIQFLRWLEFDNIKNVDQGKREDAVLEEDIQIELDNGLLVIECKGIGGTSKDSECSQISKIKHRRCEERNNFDVYALYIVNHQRFLPPLNRKNPPFSEHQIKDAKHDKRGLVTTWQLFNLYFDIENRIISKEEARSLLLNYGLVEFKPKNLVMIDEPKEFFQNGKVCIINIEDISLKVGDEIYAEKNDKFEKITIEGIQYNNKPVQDATRGEFGLKLSHPIKKKTKLYKQII